MGVVGEMQGMEMGLRRVARLVVCLVVFALHPITTHAQEPEIDRNAVTVFGGRLTDNGWEEVFMPGELEFRDSYLVGIAASRRLRSFGALSFEIEGQVVRHFDGQSHWEFNVPVIVRWSRFPWDQVIDTSVAWGIGPSYASEVPELEIAREGDSEQWLVYWLAELELKLPDVPEWGAIARLHHRSEAFGIIADEGGSNVVTLGVRRSF